MLNFWLEEALKTISEKIAKLDKPEEIIPILDEFFLEVSFDVDQKYILLINSIWDKNIYANFRSKGPIIKHVYYLNLIILISYFSS